MSTDIKLKVTEIQRFCMHDGPGIRTTVFLKGCPLRCEWCHNPETQKTGAERLFYQSKCILCGACSAVCPLGVHTVGGEHSIDRTKCRLCFACTENCPAAALEKCGRDMTVGEILSVVQRDYAFYGENGGMTLSGGEPFAQGENTVALLKACKERGISTAVETCGYASPDVIRAAVPFTDLFLWDIKDTDDTRHKNHTGVSNKLILDNLELANKTGAKIRLRCILVNGVNTQETHYANIARIAEGIKVLDCVELIPYHAYGGTKAVFCGSVDNGNPRWIPTAAQTEEARAVLTARGICVR